MIMAPIIILEADLVFERVKPVVWLATKSKVNLGIANYDINFAYTDPCRVSGKYIENNLSPGENITSDQRIALQSFETHCKALYVLEWKKEVDQLLEVKLPNHPVDAPVDRPYSEPKVILRDKREVNFSNKLWIFNDRLDRVMKRIPKWKNVTCQTNSTSGKNSLMTTGEAITILERLDKTLTWKHNRNGDDFYNFIDVIMNRNRQENGKPKTLSKRELLIKELNRLKGMEFFFK